MQERKRFSKSALIERLQNRTFHMEQTFSFNPLDGWNQVIGKGEEKNRAYGEYDTILELIDELNDWNN